MLIDTHKKMGQTFLPTQEDIDSYLNMVEMSN